MPIQLSMYCLCSSFTFITKICSFARYIYYVLTMIWQNHYANQFWCYCESTFQNLHLVQNCRLHCLKRREAKKVTLVPDCIHQLARWQAQTKFFCSPKLLTWERWSCHLWCTFHLYSRKRTCFMRITCYIWWQYSVIGWNLNSKMHKLAPVP